MANLETNSDSSRLSSIPLLNSKAILQQGHSPAGIILAIAILLMTLLTGVTELVRAIAEVTL